MSAPLVRNPTAFSRLILVANPKAGGFHALHAARRIERRVAPTPVTVYPTHPVRATRWQEIKAIVTEEAGLGPTAVLALGGDGTLNDAMHGVMLSLFGSLPELAQLNRAHPQIVANYMQAAGIYLGTVRVGTACDVGQMYGAPQDEAAAVRAYLQHPQVLPLNLGLAHMAGPKLEDGSMVSSDVLVTQSLSAGLNISPVYRDTDHWRGRSKRPIQQALRTARLLFSRERLGIRWFTYNEIVAPNSEQLGLEVLVRTLPILDGVNGFPGTPVDGLGVLVLPEKSLAEVLGIFTEVMAGGAWATFARDMRGLLPETRLATIEPRLQMTLSPGQEKTFWFYDAARCERLSPPVVAHGEYFGEARELTVMALPPYPYFLAGANSLMARYRVQAQAKMIP